MTNFLHHQVRNVSAVLVVAASLSAVTSTSSFAYSEEAPCAVHRRCLPPLQLRDPEHSEDHRLHDQEPLEPVLPAAAP